jgi:hypothetical protein
VTKPLTHRRLCHPAEKVGDLSFAFAGSPGRKIGFLRGGVGPLFHFHDHSTGAEGKESVPGVRRYLHATEGPVRGELESLVKSTGVVERDDPNGSFQSQQELSLLDPRMAMRPDISAPGQSDAQTLDRLLQGLVQVAMRALPFALLGFRQEFTE